MKPICIDSHVLIWGIKEHSEKGQEAMVPRAKLFLQQCQKSKTSIMVPSIVAGELLTAIPPNMHQMTINLLKKGFTIPPYDAIAAAEFARLWQESKNLVKEIQEDMHATRQELKADCMIVATALTRGCSAIYSHDAKLKKFANGEIPVLEIPEVEYQAELLLDAESQHQSFVEGG